MSIRTLHIALFLFLGLCYSAAAQGPDTSRRAAPPPEVDTASRFPTYVMTKNPTTAILFGIIPGGGQFYNEQYLKVPLFAGAAAFFIWRAAYYHGLFLDKAAEADAVGRNSFEYSSLKRQREEYRDERDLNVAYFLGVEILGMIDAYVGAHMFDFDVDDDENDVSSRIYLDPYRPGIGFSMKW